MSKFKAIFLAFIATVFFGGCASTADSYSTNTSRPTVPIGDIAARGAQFTAQAGELTRLGLGMKVCPDGTLKKTGGGNVTSGVGDQNGLVSYSMNVTASATSECDFGFTPKVDPKPAGGTGKQQP